MVDLSNPSTLNRHDRRLFNRHADRSRAVNGERPDEVEGVFSSQKRKSELLLGAAMAPCPVLLLLLLGGWAAITVDAMAPLRLEETTKSRASSSAASKRAALNAWSQAISDPTAIDASIKPDYWEWHEANGDGVFIVDPRVPHNAAEPPEQLVKVTNRKHRFPVLATMCSIAFLATIITLLVVCIS